jgi:DNA-binding CsgD family transcriptional regulator
LIKDYQLSKNEYRAILGFLEQLENPTENFRKQIQDLLSKIWGYHYSVLWVTDEAGNISYPHLYQIQDKVIYDYLDNYEQQDFLHPQKHLNKMSDKRVFGIYDMVSFDQFEKSEFYKGFMKKHQYYDEMVVNFTFQNRLIGTLGLLRAKGERPFNRHDVKRFEVISTFIAQKIANHMMLENLENQKRILEAHSNNSSLGLIILDSSFRTLYYNWSAKEILYDILANENEKTIDYFVKKHLIGHKNVKLGFETSIFSPSFQQYTIHVVPDLYSKIKYQKESVYFVQLIPDNSCRVHTPQVIDEFSFLTPREKEICYLVQQGYTNLQIAEQLFISINTVKRHIQNIFEKLNVKNRTSLLNKLNRF